MAKKKFIPVEIPNVEFDSTMVDLETLGNMPGCVVVSIGAVEFDLNSGKLGREFYRTVDIQSCLDAGLFMQGDTIQWWFKQSEEARQAILKDAIHLNQALLDFAKWFNHKSTIWGNGADFDIPILRMAYNAAKLIHPWQYNKGRDVRTWVAENPNIRRSLPFTGIRHEPISDCKHQIQAVVETRNSVINNLRTK